MRQACVLLVSTVTMTALQATGAPPVAVAALATTTVFNQPFTGNQVSSGTLTLPSAFSGNTACLSAAGNTTVAPISCPSQTNANGSGVLRLTDLRETRVGGAFATTSQPTSALIDVTFDAYQWNSGAAQDGGLAFVLAAADPTAPAPPANLGYYGGTLGYTGISSADGLANGYLGIGFDAFGNYSNVANQGSGCTTPAYISTTGRVPGQVVVKGPGNGRVGYCPINSTASTTSSAALALRGTTRAGGRVPVEVVINPGTVALTTNSNLVVPATSYVVAFTPVGGSKRTLTGALPSAAGILPAAWLTPSGIPRNLTFGWTGGNSGGGYREVGNARAEIYPVAPVLAVETTSYSAATPPAGTPITYTSVPTVSVGDETAPVTISHTMPAGVKPLAGYGGASWTCQPPSGQSISCTTTSTSFGRGALLPVTFSGIVTSASMTSATVQSSSSTSVSSADAATATDTAMTAGTVPSAPFGLSTTPVSGTAAGGTAVTVTASTSGSTPTILLIGTTADFQAGTPTFLLPCPAGRAAGCFNPESTSSFIQSMPARPGGGAVNLMVVTQGVGASATYTYSTAPSAPAAPSAATGYLSATVSWSAPAANGSAITGYRVTPYIGSTAQTPRDFAGTATSQTVTGLTAGTAYTFTVAATNGIGTGAASPPSPPVTPYGLPGAPTGITATAGSLQATVSWTASGSSGGSPVTGYTVTPYVGSTAQPGQIFSSTATSQVITGLTAGTAYTFTVAATNAGGTGPAGTASAAVTPNGAPSLTFGSPLTGGQVAVAYSTTLTATGGTSPFTWSVSGGSLPAGLSLAGATGVLSGTPSTAGTYSFTVRIVDSGGQTATKAASVVIAAAPTVTFTPAGGEITVAYSQQPTVSGGTGPFTWSITAGGLPSGLSIDASTGLISGTPTVSGAFSVTVAARDSLNQSGTATVSLVIAALPTLTYNPPAGGQVGVAYTTTLTAAGGVAPLAWSISAGSVPAGLTLDAGTGVLSGTPTTVGTSSFTVTVVDANGKTANKASTLAVSTGPLVITNTAAVASTTAGATVSYTVLISNTGSSTFSGATLTDDLTGVVDDATYTGNGAVAYANGATGSLSYAAPSLTWTGTLPAGSSATITYSVTVGSAPGGNQILTGTVSSGTLGTNCATGSTDSRCTSTVTVSALSIVKSADVASTAPGGTVRISILVTNTGRTAYTGATLLDNLSGMLDDATYRGDATATAGSVSFASPSLTWTGNLAVGATATITYSVTVNTPDNGDRSLTGTVASPTAGSTCPAGSPAAGCRVVVPVLVPALVINTAVGGAASTPVGHWRFDESSGTTASDAVGTQPATLFSGLGWTGNAQQGGSALAMNGRGDAYVNSTVLNTAASFSVSAWVKLDNLNGYQTVVSQDGNSVSGFYLGLQADVGRFAFVRLADDSGGPKPAFPSALSAPVVGVWYQLMGVYDAAAGTQSLYVNGQLQQTTAAPPGWTAGGGLVIGAAKYNGGRVDQVTGTIDDVYAYQGVLTGSTPTTPGAVVPVTTTISNAGRSAYTGITTTLDLTGALDDATWADDAVASSGTLSYNATTKLLTWTGDLATGAVVTVTSSVTVNNPASGDRSVSARAASTATGSICPTTNGASSCTAASAVLIPALTLTRTANVSSTTPGSVVRYTITATNSGQTAYTGAAFSEALTGILDDATYNGDAAATAGSVSYGPTLSWTGNLAVGATATVTYSVTVNDPDTGDRTLSGTVTSSTPFSNCAPGSTDARCTNAVGVLIPALSVVSTTDVGSATPGSTVRYTLTVTNTGQTTYTGAVVVADFSGVADDATQTAGTISAGTLVTSDRTYWTLTLAPGASATGIVSYVVNNPATGDRSMTTVVTSDAAGSTCPPGSTAAPCTTSVPVLQPGLTITKAASASTVPTGSTVTFTVTVSNTGETAYPSATFTDSLTSVLDDATYDADVSASSGIASYGSSAVSWTGALAIGASATITYSVTVRDPDPGDKQLSGAVRSTSVGSNCGSGSTDSRCSTTVRVLVPGLTITQSAGPASTAPGAVVPFTITVTNTGQTAYTGAAFALSLAGILDDATYNGNVAATAGTVGYTNSAVTWTGNLTVGASATVTFSATVRAADVGNDLLAGTVVSSTSGNNCAISSTDARCSTSVPVARLTIVETSPYTFTTPGSALVLTATFTNTGQVPYTGISVSNSGAGVLDDVVTSGDQTASSGTLSVTPTALIWTGSIPVGGSVTITGNVTVLDPDTGDRLITTTWTSAAPGNNCPSGGTDPRCTVAIPVLLPGLTISQAADASTATPGGTVGYTVTVANTGETPYTAVIVTNALDGILDDATVDADAQASTGSVSSTGTTLTWTGDLAVGATVTITFSVTVHDPDTGDKALTSTLRSSAAGNNCSSASTDPACSSSVSVLTPVLTVVTSADRPAATLGATVTFSLTVTNAGQTTYAPAAVSQSLAGVLDDALYNDDAAATRGAVGVTGGVLSWSGTLAPGDTATITYSVMVRNPASGNRSMTVNAASADAGSNCAVGSVDTRCAATVTVTNAVALTFSTTADVPSTVAGGVVRYTVTVVNATTSAVDAVSFGQSLAGVLDDAAYNGDVAASAGTPSLTGDTVSWSGPVPARGSVTVTYSVTVNSTMAGDEILAATLTSTSVPSGNNCPAGSPDARCSTSVPVAALVLSQAYAQNTTTPGAVIGLTATFTNTGRVPYQGITVSSSTGSTLDDATPNGDQTATSGTLVLTATAIVWTGDIPIGGSVTVTGTLTVKDPATGNGTMTGTLVSSAPGNTCPAGGIDPRCVSLTTVVVPALTITTTPDTSTVSPGDTVGYQVTVQNTGQTAYTGLTVTDSLAAVLDDATYNADAAAGVGAVAYTAPTLTWTGDLAVGATATITFSVTVRDPDTGDKVLTDVVRSTAYGSNCPTASGDTRCRSTVAVLTPGLTIVSSADRSAATLGSIVTYSVSITNSGQTPYPAATFTDSLIGVIDDADYNGDATVTPGDPGSVDDTGGAVVWTGPLDPGESAAVTFSVTVGAALTGDAVLADAVTSTSTGTNCAVGSTDARCTATVGVVNNFAMTFTKTADVPTTVGGAVVVYTLTATNAATTAVTGSQVTDSLTGVLDDAIYNGDGTASGGTLGYAASELTWTGDVPAGDTITISYSVTVNTAITGDQILTGTLVSTDPSESNNCLTGSVDARCVSTVPVARLALAYSPQTVATTTPGAAIQIVSTYTNTGTVPFQGISVGTDTREVADDVLPGVLSVDSGTLVFGPTGISWVGDIPVGGTVTVVGDGTVLDPDTGNGIIRATMFSTAAGNNCPTNSTDSRCSVEITVLTPELTIGTTADTTAVDTGGVVDYTVSIANTGETPYTAATVTASLSGLLDDATYNTDAATDIGAVSYTSPTVTWTGDLAVGESATITFSVTVADPGTGDKTMITSLVSTEVGSSCPPASGNPGCRSTVLVLTPGLTVATTTDATVTTLGATVRYAVTAHNSGQAFPLAVVTDSLAGVLDDATYNGDVVATGGTAVLTGEQLTWIGFLSPGSTVTITFSVTVDPGGGGDRTMNDRAVSSTRGSNCTAASTDPRCTSSVAVIDSTALVASVTAGASSAVSGQQVPFTITVVNAGATVLSGADITMPLTGILDDAAYNADAAASSGTVGYTGSDLTWTGTLVPGETVTLGYSVTVNGTGTGDERLDGTLTSSSPSSSNNCLSGSTDDRCGVSVPIAALHLVQTASSATTTPGSVITLVTTFTNTGQVPYQGISIASPRADTSDDTVPTGNQTVSSGTLVRSAAAVTWTGDIPVGGVVTSTRTLTVRNPPTGNRTITATLYSDAPGNNCPADTADPDCTFATSVLVPGLSVGVAADAGYVVPGGTAGFTITITNTGETAYTGAVVAGNLAGLLDEAVYNLDAVASSGAVSFTSPSLTWTGDLAVGGSATITYSATARAPATGDKTMVSSVSSAEQGSTCPAGGGSAGCSVVVPVLTPALTIVSGVDSRTALPADTVSYTVSAVNSGQTDYSEAGFVIDLAGIQDDAADNGDAAATSGQLVLTGSSLSWSGPLAVGEEVTVTVSVTVADPDTGDHRLGQAVTSTVSGSNCPAGGTDPRCSTSVDIAGVTIVSASDVSTAKPTDVITFTGTFTNTGRVPYYGITVVVDVSGAADDATYNGDAAVSAGDVSIVPNAPQVSWTGDLPVGASVQFSASVTVNNPETGDGLIRTQSSTTAAASNCPAGSSPPGSWSPSADPRCDSIVQVLTPELSITVAADTTTTTPGSTVGYLITIENTGETDYLAATVTDAPADLLGGAHYNDDAVATVGSVGHTGSSVVWTGDLAVGETAQVTFSVQIDDPYVGSRALISRAHSDELGSTCPTGGTGSGCTATVTVLLPALQIEVGAESTTSTPGSAVEYTVVITNTGETVQQGATVTAALTGALDDASYDGDAGADTGTVAFTGSALIWTGNLGLGESTTVTYSLTVDDPDTGNRSLDTSVTSAAAGSTCTQAQPCSSTVTVLLPQLVVTTNTDTGTATPGDTVRFTITIANVGETRYETTSVTTSLAGITDDATLAGSILATSGTVGLDAPTLTWTGSLGLGEQVTISYAAVVDDPDTGDRSLTSTVVSAAAESNCAAGSTDPTCTATVQVLIPELTITKTADTATTVPGAVVTYTIDIDNTGETDYVAATVSDSLAGVLMDAAYNGDADSDTGSVDYTDSVLTWAGDLGVGDAAVVTYSITVLDPDTGDKSIGNTAVSTAPGSRCPPGGTDPACTATVQVLIPALTVTQAADTSTVMASGVVTYSITVHNTGETAYAPATVTASLTGILDDADYKSDAAATSGSVAYADDALTWSGGLAVGDIATITFSVTTTFPAPGDHDLTSTVVSTDPGSTCAADGADPSCTTTVTVLIPELTVTKSVDTTEVVVSGTVLYTLTATNTGEADYPAVTLTDPLAGILDDATYNADATATSGTVGYSGGTLSWTGGLGTGASVVVTYSATATGGGDMVLSNTVVSGTVGSTCTSAQDTQPPCATATVVNDRSIELNDLTESFTLAGPADAVVTHNGAISMTVDSNNPGGYMVTVHGESDELISRTTVGGPTIPLSDLLFRPTGTTAFTPLSTAPQVLYERDSASSPDGDAVSSDFRMHLPFVDPDTYTVTLEYIVSAR